MAYFSLVTTVRFPALSGVPFREHPGPFFRIAQVLDLLKVDSEVGGFFGGFASDGYGYLVPSRSFKVRFLTCERAFRQTLTERHILALFTRETRGITPRKSCTTNVVLDKE